MYGTWECSCSIGGQNASWSNPDGQRDDVYNAIYNQVGATRIDEVWPNWVHQGTDFTMGVNGCNLGTDLWAADISLSNITQPAEDQVTASAHVVGGSGHREVCIKKYSGATGDDADCDPEGIYVF